MFVTPDAQRRKGERGAAAELEVSAQLLRDGFDVFRNVAPNGPVDIVALKDGVVYLYDVKSKSGTLSDVQRAMGVRLIMPGPEPGPRGTLPDTRRRDCPNHSRPCTCRDISDQS